MVIHPFRAVRFNQDRVKLADVVTQPYDKIDTAMQAVYYKKSPYNIVRVIKSREVDVRGDEGYIAAGRLWSQWMKSDLFVHEHDPALFIYRQRFAIGERSYLRHAVVGLLDLGHADRVLAHERTLSAPRTDRLRLIRQTESNDGLIFLLYRDPARVIQGIADSLAGCEPLEAVTDEHFTEHEIFRCPADRQQELASVFNQGEMVIADGHHRFAVALQFMEECRANGWKPAGVESFDKRMVALVEMTDPGLVILPAHRVVFGIPGFRRDSWEQRMSAGFEKTSAEDLSDLLNRMAQSGPGNFGVFDGRSFALWKRRQTPGPDELDVAILHEEILDSKLGIGETQVTSESRVRYFRDAAAAVQEVRSANGQLAFLLNPTKIEQVESCARRLQVMPQKSTDFFPKMLTGMLFMKMEIDKGENP
jgi:uncharacterized protein (DUF1015 family)